MKRKILFIITNVLLVAIVGALIGVFCKDIFATGTSMGGYIAFVIALCLPSLVYFVGRPLGFAVTVDLSLLMAAEIIADIIFMCKPDFPTTSLVITQASILGAFLIASLVIIASIRKEDK